MRPRCQLNILRSNALNSRGGESVWFFFLLFEPPSGLVFNGHRRMVGFCSLSAANRLKNEGAMLSCLWIELL